MSSAAILLVEDNADDEALTLRALRRHNIAADVHVVRDGAEALRYLFPEDADRDSTVRMPVVMLLDLMLPKVSGLDVLKRVRSADRTKLLPVVVLTSSDEERDIVKSYELGANSYVCKPVGFDQFSDTVSRLGQYWTLTNRSAADAGRLAGGQGHRPMDRDA
jgi:DNA-binding response OmpR family regulator